MRKTMLTSRILRVIVQACIIIGMLSGVALFAYVTIALVPQEVKTAAANEIPLWLTMTSYALATLCFVGLEYIALVLFKMMRSLAGDPFVEANVKALRNMGAVALGVSVCGLLTMAFRAVPVIVLAALPIALCGLFSLVLSGVFEQAVEYKRENDLTI